MVYTCDICYKTFYNIGKFNQHKSNMHQSEVEEDNVSDDESEEESKQDSEIDEQESDSEESNDDDENEPWVVDVWKQMRDEADSTNRFLDIYKDNVTFAKSLARDETHKKVMETFKKAQTEDDMDFIEALDFAVDRRKFLIQREFEDDDDSDVRYTLNDDTAMDV